MEFNTWGQYTQKNLSEDDYFKPGKDESNNYKDLNQRTQIAFKLGLLEKELPFIDATHTYRQKFDNSSQRTLNNKIRQFIETAGTGPAKEFSKELINQALVYEIGLRPNKYPLFQKITGGAAHTLFNTAKRDVGLIKAISSWFGDEEVSPTLTNLITFLKSQVTNKVQPETKKELGDLISCYENLLLLANDTKTPKEAKMTLAKSGLNLKDLLTITPEFQVIRGYDPVKLPKALESIDDATLQALRAFVVSNKPASGGAELINLIDKK